MIKYTVCLSIVILFLFSCKEDVPKGLLSQKKMVAVFADIMKVEVYTKNFVEKDTSKNANIENAKMQMQVFELHKVSKEDFYRSYDYYMANSTKMQPVFDSIINNINTERIKKYSKPILDTVGQ